MQANFFDPPREGTYVQENTPAGEIPVRKCLILAFDDHTGLYLIADYESGEHQWHRIFDVRLDCPAVMGDDVDDEEDEPKGDPCPVCKRPMPD